MNTQELKQQQEKLTQQNIDYGKILRILWSRWYWITGCIIIAIAITKIYLWYTPPVYSTTASLKFDDKSSDISALVKKSEAYDNNNRLQSESYVIQSREVLLNAISHLDYRVSFYLKGRVRTTEMYPYVPYPIEIIQQDTTGFYRGLFDIQKTGKQEFRLSYSKGNELVEQDYHFGDVIKAPGLIFRIAYADIPENTIYSFRFNRKEDFLGRATTGLSMREAVKSSNVLLVTLIDKNPAFAADLLNAIMAEYIRFDVTQKSTSATQTISFIDNQLDFLSGKVQQAGSAVEHFKRTNQLVDPKTNTRLALDNISELEKQKSEVNLEALSIGQLESQIKNNRNATTLNLNLEGKINSLLGSLLDQFNQLILERQKRLTQYTLTSQPVQETESRIREVRQAISHNINAYRDRITTTRNYIDQQLQAARAKLNTLPAYEKDFVNLESEFDINQRVFSFLSEKKLEAQINRAAVVPGASIVEKASTGSRLVSPIPSRAYTYAILVGLLCGIGLIVLVRITNPFIYDKNTVEALTQTPILGLVRRFPNYIDPDNSQALSLEKPKSVFAESVRSVRTNLSFLASEKQSKTICITSEIAGEGKSFVGINLASTLALIDKKVILIGADLRRSKLHKTFKADNKHGLSTYLANQDEAENIIQHSETENMDFITSGPVPPNPSELLHSERMKALLTRLREQYDFVLIDTAPVGLVSDAIPLIRQSDINLFIIRAGVSRFNAATIPDRIAGEYHLSNVAIVLNAFGDDALHGSYYSSSYSTGYYNTYYYYSDYNGYSKSGYYTDEEQTKWWQFWKRIKR